MTDLYRLVYSSRNLLSGSDSEVAASVAGILATSQRNNTRVGVTGALMFDRGAFAQVLEGPQHAVEATFERIQRDPRHGDVTVLECATVHSQGFPNWSMAFVGQSAAGQTLWHAMAAASGFDLSRLEGDAVFSMLHSLVLEEEDLSVAAPDATIGSFDADRVRMELPRPGRVLEAKVGSAEVSPSPMPEDPSLGHAAQPTQAMPASGTTMISLAIFRAALADERVRTTELRNELDDARVLLAEGQARVAAVSGERDRWARRARALAAAMCEDTATFEAERLHGSGIRAAEPTHAQSSIRSIA